MTLKSYLWGMRIGTVLSLFAWVLVLFYVDPDMGVLGKILFFMTTFLLLSGIAILFFTWSRKKLSPGHEVAFAFLGVSFRQGVLLALLTILLLVLQSFRLLLWWNGMLVVAGVLLIELYFLTRK